MRFAVVLAPSSHDAPRERGRGNENTEMLSQPSLTIYVRHDIIINEIALTVETFLFARESCAFERRMKP